MKSQKFIPVLLALLTWLTAGPALLAATPPSPQPFIQPSNPADMKVYEASYALCSDSRATNILKFFLSGAEDDVFKGKILQVSDALDSYLDNMWFHVALEECFPQNLHKKMALITELVAADIAGKAVGDAAVLYIFKRIDGVFAALKKFSRFGYYSLQTAFWAPFVYEVSKEFKNERDEHQDFLKTHPVYKETLDLEKQGKIKKEDFSKAYTTKFHERDSTLIDGFRAQLLASIDEMHAQYMHQLSQARTPAEREALQNKLEKLEKLKAQQLAEAAQAAREEQEIQNPSHVTLQDLEKIRQEISQLRQTLGTLQAYSVRGKTYYRLSFTSEVAFGLAAVNATRVLAGSQQTLAGRFGALSPRSPGAWKFWLPVAGAVTSYALKTHYGNDLELTETQKRLFQSDLDDDLAQLDNMEKTYQSLHSAGTLKNQP